MNINRNNYEEYFMLYIDRELNDAEQAAVEAYVQAHPDLKAELEMLKSTVLEPATTSFPGKDDLLKHTDSELPVNADNCEAFFILYADEELNKEEQEAVEQFVYSHPQYQESFELYLHIRLTADKSIQFPNKKILYRSTAGGRLISFNWRQLAAAVVFFMIAGFLWYALQPADKNPGTSTVVAGNLTSNSSDGKQTDKVKSNVKSPAEQEETSKGQNLSRNNMAVRKPNRIQQQSSVVYAVAVRENKAITNDVLTGQQEKITEEEKFPEHSNFLPEAGVSPTTALKQVEVPRVKPASVSDILQPAAMDEEISFAQLDKNDRPANAVLTSQSNSSPVAALGNAISEKTRVGGLIHKISRVVDKATHLSPDEEEAPGKKGLRIASFEIALK